MMRPIRDDPAGSLFVAERRGVRCTLVCLDDGRYAIGRNGLLLPDRWTLGEFAECFRAFARLADGTDIGQPAAVPPPTIGLPPAWAYRLAAQPFVRGNGE